MKPAIRTLAAAACAVASVCAAHGASACQFTRTPWGLRVSDCKLSELYPGRYDVVLDTDPKPGIVIALPNLEVTNVEGTVIEKAVDITVELVNNGVRSAGGFEVAVMTEVKDPLYRTNPTAPVPLGPVVLSGLAAGAGVKSYAGRVFLANRAQDWDVCTVAVVDPKAAGTSQWAGRVLESNESDNTWPPPRLWGCCRVYGPTPDLNGPPGCR